MRLGDAALVPCAWMQFPVLTRKIPIPLSREFRLKTPEIIGTWDPLSRQSDMKSKIPG